MQVRVPHTGGIVVHAIKLYIDSVAVVGSMYSQAPYLVAASCKTRLD